VWEPTVELRELRAFLVLCEELHFGRAAERLHLTPSRVSQIIRALEEKLGRQLVHRTSRSVELTELGHRFRDEAGDAYERLAGVLERTQATGREARRPLRLNLFVDPGVAQIARIVKAFERRYPGSVIEATEVPIDDPFGPLRRGEVDVVASWLPHGQPGVLTGPILSSEPRVLAVASDHPLAGRTAISIEEVAKYRVMRFETMPTAFHEVWIPSRTPAGRPIRHQPFSNGSLGDRGRMTSELLHLIATGRIVHPTVRSFANMFGHPDVVYVPIADLPALRSALVWLRDTNHPRVRDLARVAEDVISDPAGPEALARA
jgi:DNA-binding transcriptional LysR family regulator